MPDDPSALEKPTHSTPLIQDCYDKETLYEMIIRALLDANNDSFYIKDRLGRMNIVNQRVLMDLGSADQVIGRTDSDFFGAEFGQKTRMDEEHLFNTGIALEGLIEVRGDAQSGLFWSSTTKIPLKDPEGKIVGLIGITRNINEIKIREQKLHILATHDPLTNVYNRTGLVDRLDDMIHQSGNQFAVLAIDLDNFKQINDVYLHKTGDDFLTWFAWLLKANLRGNDIVARVGGDEFVVILNKIEQKSNISGYCEKLYANFAFSIEERFRSLGVGMSIGISIYPNDSRSANQLLEQADVALYEAKDKNKGTFRFFSENE